MSRNVKKNLIPKFNVPEGFTSKTYLEKIVWDGFEDLCKKYDYVKENDSHKERLNKELKVINELDAEDYFLIVHDYVKSVGKSEVDISKLEEYFEKDVFDLISNAGAIKNGVSEEIGELIFDEMVEHAPNAYSKSSAISETMSMYLSAYDKYHYSGVYFKYFSKQ